MATKLGAERMNRRLDFDDTPSDESGPRRGVKRKQSERHKAYAGFQTLVTAELKAFGPPGLSHKGRVEEVPLFSHTNSVGFVEG